MQYTKAQIHTELNEMLAIEDFKKNWDNSFENIFFEFKRTIFYFPNS